ncbi:hypothetical protein VNI00_006500 [Paramarasmius palmivorus]|uniref:Uncharacterized protein n=1 Tax=Paramarasmius palmivorus TaxID=297713 RepID=A0AAW0D8A9_9AGAR
MPRSLETIGLLTAEEKANAHAVLLQEHTLLRDDSVFTWKSVRGVFFTPHAWLTFLMGFLGGETLTSLAYFEPSIVQSLGYKANEAQLMSVPPFAVAWAVNIITAVVSDKFRLRGVTIIFHALLATIGFAIFLGSKNPNVQYGSLFLFVPGVYCQPPSLLSWTANNAAPRYRRAAAIAFLLSTTGLGGIAATYFHCYHGGVEYPVVEFTEQEAEEGGEPGEVLDDTSSGFIYKL